jgi:hypothetical protein
MHINGPRRRGTIRPITAAECVRAFSNIFWAFSSLDSATQSSNPPLV